MLSVIESIRMRLKKRVGCFGLYGYDFMIDQDMKAWLIEINVNPALTTNTNTLIQAIPPVVKESILLSIECFEKIRHERKDSLPYIEKKCAITSLPNTRKGQLSPINNFPTRSNTMNSGKILQKQNDQKILSTEKAILSYQTRQKDERPYSMNYNERLSSSFKINNSITYEKDSMLIKYQTIQRYRTNFEILKPATVIAEEWDNLDDIQKNHLSIGGSKSLVLISKCSTRNKSNKTLQT
ncbi:unnamed protein product [Rotaria sp. Silwood2]|nr:unnamed protein product [Rotaria sp. Silwood2]